MKRGEIYYIYNRYTVGAEIKKARPAVIVSNNTLNATAEVVEVVYLTTQPKRDLPTHVTVRSSGVVSTALCEQVDTVSKDLVGDLCAVCTDEEMGSINTALLVSLGIEAPRATREEVMTKAETNDSVNHPSHYTSGKIEVIDFIEDQKLPYHLGNVVKYVARAGKKDKTKTVEDLKKAAWYINRYIEQAEAGGIV